MFKLTIITIYDVLNPDTADHIIITSHVLGNFWVLRPEIKLVYIWSLFGLFWESIDLIAGLFELNMRTVITCG